MNESKLKNSSSIGYIVALIITLLICGTAIFISIYSGQIQKDIANTQAQATKESAKSIEDGLNKTGAGIEKIGDGMWYLRR